MVTSITPNLTTIKKNMKKLKSTRHIHQTGLIVIEYLTENGCRHREEDLPAVYYRNGDCEWWQNGRLHRENGPARILHDGEVEYYHQGKLHNLQGYASTFHCSTKNLRFVLRYLYCVHGVKLCKRDKDDLYDVICNRFVMIEMNSHIFE